MIDLYLILDSICFQNKQQHFTSDSHKNVVILDAIVQVVVVGDVFVNYIYFLLH